MKAIIQIIFWLWPLFFFAACNNVAGTDEGCINPTGTDLPPEGTPTQFCIEGDPEIRFVHNPESPFVVMNEPALQFEVVAEDSIPHLNWLPTSLQIETDQGFKEMITLVPFACIIPIENSTEEFPFNVEWWSCNRININNGEELTEDQILEIESITNSRLHVELLFQTMDGGQYIFELNDVGQMAIEDAIPAIKQLPYIKPIENEEFENVGHTNSFPRCWLSDVVPPPPCPPWSFFRTFRLSFEEDKENHITVQEGGWVKATYTLPDGSSRSTTFTVPEINQGSRSRDVGLVK